LLVGFLVHPVTSQSLAANPEAHVAARSSEQRCSAL